MRNEFDRIKRLPPYVFAEVNNLKAKLRSKGKDIIDFGMGNPDMPTPKHIRQKLKETVEKPGTGRYSTSKGINGPIDTLTCRISSCAGFFYSFF